MQKKVTYVADDGKEFPTETLCARYERAMRFVARVDSDTRHKFRAVDLHSDNSVFQLLCENANTFADTIIALADALRHERKLADQEDAPQ